MICSAVSFSNGMCRRAFTLPLQNSAWPLVYILEENYRPACLQPTASITVAPTCRRQLLCLGEVRKSNKRVINLLWESYLFNDRSDFSVKSLSGPLTSHSPPSVHAPSFLQQINSFLCQFISICKVTVKKYPQLLQSVESPLSIMCFANNKVTAI